MSLKLDIKLAQNNGTKFRIFPAPRFLEGFSTPETIRVSVTTDKIQVGPADDRMYVVDAINKLPYDRNTQPPYLGAKNPPVQPGADGHFDNLDPNSRDFSCATMYATVRRVLDIWQDFFGRTIQWHFSSFAARMEMIPLIEWDNAQSGWGFLEFGYGRTVNGGIDHDRPYCQNFDVLSHELGHSIIFAEVGTPATEAAETPDYGGFHESSGDLVAIVSTLHFDSVVDHVLKHTRGNLFTPNELSRLGELSATRQIRIAFNDKKMSDVDDEPHNRSLPLTGAIFDTLVNRFQMELVKKNLISANLAQRSRNPGAPTITSIQDEFDAAYQGNEVGFKTALLNARDYLGYLLAKTWGRLSPNFLTYEKVLNALLAADRDLTEAASQQESQQAIRENFAWREIGNVRNSRFLANHRLSDCHVTQDYDNAAALRSLGVKPNGAMAVASGVLGDFDVPMTAVLQAMCSPAAGGAAQNGGGKPSADGATYKVPAAVDGGNQAAAVVRDGNAPATFTQPEVFIG